MYVHPSRKSEFILIHSSPAIPCSRCGGLGLDLTHGTKADGTLMCRPCCTLISKVTKFDVLSEFNRVQTDRADDDLYVAESSLQFLGPVSRGEFDFHLFQL
jgi:hypothetical protein